MKANLILPKAPKIVLTELEAIANLWLAFESAAASGDREARAFASGTFGPWARKMIRTHAS